MPRGYLKHSEGVSKRKARGGSSGRGKSGKKDVESPKLPCEHEDFAISSRSSPAKCNAGRKATAAYLNGECSICFKEGPVACLSNKCKWHDAACKQCLHRMYVTEAQKSPKCYPLTCFHPLCDQTVHAAQLTKHNVFASPEEVRKHHETLVLSKIRKTAGMRTVYCPECDSPRGIRKLGDSDRMCGCVNCHIKYQVSPFYATLRALDNMKSDGFGINDGWANCPGCGILISKGDGCIHMCCINCDYEFYWDEVQEKKSRVRHARVPENEIHLWW